MNKLKEKKIFAIKVRDYGLSIERDWYIEYKKINETDKIVKRQYRGDINKYVTVAERQAEVSKILNYITLKNALPPKRPGSRVPVSPILSKHSFFDSLAKDFLEYKKNRVRQKTYQNYRYVLQSFSYFLQRNNLEACKIEHIGESIANQYINSIELSNNSKNKHLTICKQVFNFALKNRLIKSNPFLSIEGFSKEATPPAAFNKKQREKLKQYIQRKDSQLWVHCMFMFYTFIRPGELRKLKIENIYLDENKIEIPATVSKNKKLQFVQIPKQLKNIIKNMELDEYSCDCYLFSSDGKPGPIMLGQNNIRTRFSNFLKALNFSSRYKLYSWKHTGVAECARAGLNLKDIQMQLRHHSLEMTDQYLKSLGIMDNERIRNKFPDL